MFQIGSILVLILQIFLFALLGRLILDYVRIFARNWRPSGISLYFVEAVYSITEKPMSFVRRFIPPLRIGAVSLDLSFIVLFFAIQLLIPIVGSL
ncbi:MAG: YggT family protein [Candidatus Planktophila sp.]|jgi:YggT family protein|nr:YggT family protein [Candidatus Planktophila sp.]